MANAAYPLGLKALLDGDFVGGLDGLNIKACLIDTAAYTYSATHQYLSDVAGAAIIATTGNLASKTTTGGVFDAADASIAAVAGATVEAVIVYQDSGAAATSRLICYAELAAAYTPIGADTQLVMHASGIFSIAAVPA